MLRDKNQC